MSAVVHPISENPRLRIRRLVETLVARQQAAALEKLRASLPLDDPDRHALDTVADAAFDRLGCSPKDGAA